MIGYKIITTSSFDTIILIIGGLSIFLFGISLTKSNLKSLASKRIQNVLIKLTNSKFKSFLFGFIFTVLIQSSSGVCAIVISFMAAGYLSLRQGTGIMIGSNVGTCITAFLIGINMEELSLIIIVVTSILSFIYKTTRKLYICQAILGIGILFLGLQFMDFGFNTISKQPDFQNIIQRFVTLNSVTLLLGILMTSIIQSSSAIIGIVEKMYSSGILTLSSSILIMFGSNIGTTLTSFLSTVDSPKDTKKAVWANVIFNLCGVILFLIILKPYIILLEFIEITFSLSKEITIAFSHLIFNIITVIIVYFLFDKLILIVSKDKEKNLEDNNVI